MANKDFTSAPSRPQRNAAPTARLSTPPDQVYRSLLALLASPNTSSAASHLQLLPANSLYASISHYLSTLPPADVDGFVKQLISSQPLWFTIEQQPNDATSQTHLEGTNSSTPAPLPSLLDRSKALSQAVAHAVLNYIKLLLIDRSGDKGWRTRRSLAQWVRNLIVVAQRSYYEGVEAAAVAMATTAGASQTSPVASLPYLTLLSGLLLGLAAHEAQRKEAKAKGGLLSDSGLSARRVKAEVEDELCAFLSELLGEDPVAPAAAPALVDADKDATQLVKAAHGGPPVEAKPESLKDTAAEGDHADQVTAPSESDWEKEFSARQAAFESASKPAPTTSASSGQKARLALPPALLRGQAGAIPLLVLLSTVSPHISDEKLGTLPPLRTIELLSSLTIPGIFNSDVALGIFSHLSSSFAGSSTSKAGVEAMDAVQNNALFASLGPLARIASVAAGKAVESGKADALVEPEGLLEVMERTARRWGEAWESVSPVGALVEGEEEKAARTRFWTISKTLLFGYVMIYDGVMEGIIDMCPSPTVSLPAPTSAAPSSDGSFPRSTKTSDGAKLPLTTKADLTTSNIPASYIASITSILSAFSHLAFITSTFGADAFEAYNRVLFGALEVLGRDRLACEAVLGELGRLARGTRSRAGEKVVYYLDTAEQVAPFVSDRIIADEVLELCKAHLETSSNKRAFESSHSVVLSILNSHPSLVPSLTPYYSSLVLRLFPSELTEGQLEHALTTLVGAASEVDDALAWMVIERLAEEVERWRFVKLGLAEGEGKGKGKESDEATQPEGPSSTANDAANGDEGAPTLKPATQTPASIHLSLQTSLISLLPTLNLVLLRSTLSKTTGYILSHPAGSFERRTLCDRAFEGLQGLNAATREEGLRWWLDKRKEFGV